MKIDEALHVLDSSDFVVEQIEVDDVLEVTLAVDVDDDGWRDAVDLASQGNLGRH